MASQVSAPVKILALVGALAALAMGAWMMTAGGAPTEEAADVALTPVEQIPKAQAAAGALNAHNAATAKGATRPKKAASAKAAKKATAAKAAPVAVSKPVEKPDPGTPTTIAGLLRQHEVVVVLLYDPESRVDDYSLAEAALGAKEADAGFLRVNVLNQRQALPFTNAYGVLQDPTVLFFERPGKLVLKLTGFADHETVAQAAHNAALGLGTVSPS